MLAMACKIDRHRETMEGNKSNNKMKLQIIRTRRNGCEMWTLNKNRKSYEKRYGKILRVSHRTNQSIADELGATSGTPLNFIKKHKLSYFGHIKRHQTLEKLILKGKGRRNGGKPKRYLEKDVEDWMGAGVWRVGRTADDRLMFGRSINNSNIQKRISERDRLLNVAIVTIASSWINCPQTWPVYRDKTPDCYPWWSSNRWTWLTAQGQLDLS